jgi:large subunit ribosomal protein L28
MCCIKECGKKPHVGNLVSHANNRVKQWIYPNVHTVRFTLTNDPRGYVYRGAVCTKCMKAGKIRKV